MLITTDVEIRKLNYKSALHFYKKGYNIPYKKDNNGKLHFATILDNPIVVKVEDLPNRSNIEVQCQCDYCGDTYMKKWSLVYNVLFVSKHSKLACTKCKTLKMSEITQIQVSATKTDIKPFYRDKEWLYNEYIVKNRSAEDIADECGINVRNIREYLAKYGVKKTIDYHEILSKELFVQEYVDNMMTKNEIADKYKIGLKSIDKLIKEYGLHKRTSGESISLYNQYKGGLEEKKKKSLEVWQREGFREKMRKINKECANKLEHRIKLSATIQGINVEDWNGFVTTEKRMIRKKTEYSDWRNAVFARDNYTCQCCGDRSGNGHSVVLHAHHKENFADNPDLRFDVDNGITLCDKCHSPKYKGSFHNIYGTMHNNGLQLEEYLLMKKKEVI